MCKILLVDDDQDVREATGTLLTSWGHQIAEAEDGLAGLEWLGAHRGDPPCMAIVDLMMPVMNGWELVAAVRRHPFFSNLFIIVFSAAVRRGAPPNVAADICWPKPPSFDQLEHVQELCRYHGNPAPSGTISRNGARAVTRIA